MSSYLIGLSGPPRSGKDALGRHLAFEIEHRFGFAPMSIALSMPLRLMTFAMIGREYSRHTFERDKDVPLKELDGASIRQAMIRLSEEHVKPRYGKGHWARAALNLRHPTNPRIVIITDMGFPEEVEVLEQVYGKERCLWLQLARPGHSFAGDSRSYVGSEDRVVRIDNATQQADGGAGFFSICAGRICEVIKTERWNFD